LLLVVGAAAGAGAAAIAAVPGSDGVIHACYEVNQNNGAPLETAPNLRIIDPSAGQTCNPVGAARAPEQALSWNVSGPPGPQGPAGSPGAQGAAGSQGPTGPAGSTVSIDGQTFTLGNGKTLTGPTSVVPPLEPATGASPVATMTLGGDGGTSSDVLAWQLVSAPAGTAARGKPSVKGIQIVKRLDKSSPTLFKACATGKHFPKVVLTVRAATAAGGPETITLTNATVVSYATEKGTAKGKGGSDLPTESLSLNFTHIVVNYQTQ
jgi:type VI secretion system secreted protein Hcp